MGKKGGAIRYNKETKIPKIQSRPAKFTEEDMDDEIDAFHKQRDIIPLDLDDDMGSSDEDNVHSVYDIPGSDEDEEEDEYVDDKFTRKMAKQQQYMRQKTGGVKDETHDDDEEEEEETLRWGLRNPYGGDNADMDGLDSDNEDAVEEENEALRIHKESLKSYSTDNFGLGDDDLVENASDAENLEDVPKAKSRSKHQPVKEAEDDSDIACEKDINALSKEEQMEVVYSSAPEVVGLLSELKDALNQLDKVNPLISMVKKRNDNSKEGIHFLETKKLLLLAYCQAISFYLLLKSEGQSVRDHPVLARLVEFKSLLNKMKQIDDKLPSDLEEILDQDNGLESDSDTGSELMKETVTLASETVSNDIMQSPVSVVINEKALVNKQNGFLKDNGSKEVKQKRQVSSRSMEMLKMRESLEQKLKQKGVFSSVTGASRSQKFATLPANRQLETIYDYGDEIIDKEGSKVNMANGRVTKLPKLISTKPKNKVISGDDDLPLRDDIGERRRKYEQRVLAKAGVDSNDENEGSHKRKNVKLMNVDDEEEKDETDEDGEDEFYKKVKRQRSAKLSQKEEIYSRKPSIPYLADTDIAEGKRGINRQIEKNRGLTRYRKKQNPRTEYKKSYEKKLKNRGGQVRNMKKPTGSYGGETSGINAGISRSKRF